MNFSMKEIKVLIITASIFIFGCGAGGNDNLDTPETDTCTYADTTTYTIPEIPGDTIIEVELINSEPTKKAEEETANFLVSNQETHLNDFVQVSDTDTVVNVYLVQSNKCNKINDTILSIDQKLQKIEEKIKKIKKK
jgi:hypothetical protein